jgi:hypothetical protein
MYTPKDCTLAQARMRLIADQIAAAMIAAVREKAAYPRAPYCMAEKFALSCTPSRLMDEYWPASKEQEQIMSFQCRENGGNQGAWVVKATATPSGVDVEIIHIPDSGATESFSHQGCGYSKVD